MGFSLGAQSKNHLIGIHPSLVHVVYKAIATSLQDFSVHEGLRTLDKQREYVRTGVSWTLESKHLMQTDGFGHAVDLVPYINGQLRWEWPPIYKIASAVSLAASELNVELIWGGVWDKRMSAYGTSPEAIKAEVAAYCARHPGIDRIDGPHYQLVTK